jgi:hypothetical protein
MKSTETPPNASRTRPAQASSNSIPVSAVRMSMRPGGTPIWKTTPGVAKAAVMGEETKTFFARSSAAFWDTEYAGRFLAGVAEKPKFPISSRRAFTPKVGPAPEKL